LSKETWPHLGFRNDIQGLRAIAVLLVILFHADIPGLHGGYIGVDVFFVISGYLISGLLFRELVQNGKISFADFYARRIRRILPLSVFVVVASLIFFAVFVSPWELKELSKTTLLTSIFSSNIWFITQATDYFGAETESNPFLHTWSLAVEEQFYFIWPALLALLVLVTRNKRLWMWLLITISASSFIAFVLLFAQNQPLAFFSMPTRAWQFGAGALIYFLPQPQIKSKSSVLSQVAAGAGLVFIIGSAYVIDAGFDNEPLWALPPTLGACMIIWAGQRQQGFWLFRLLASQPLVHIGTLSYSLYLWHWPIIVFLKLNSERLGINDIIWALALTYLLSWLSYRYIEAKLRKHEGLNTNFRSILFGGILIVLGLGSSLVLYLYAKNAMKSPAQQFIESTQFANKQASLCVTAITDTALSECELGDTQSNKVIAVFGDSKAQQWLPVLNEIGEKQGWKVVPILKAGCSPAYIDPFLVFLGREYHECNIWRESALEKLINLKPDIVIITHYYGYQTSEKGSRRIADNNDWQKGYELLNHKLSTLSSKVLLIRDNPQFPISIPKCLSRVVGINTITENMCAFTKFEMKFRDFVYEAAKSEFANNEKVSFLDLNAYYCKDNICLSFHDGIVRYTDRHHLSYSFTKELGPLIETALMKL
tara:strand:+ start:1460 stop:3418 length:1959 start_codon:yes stop_codon:yes gene_type:complete